MDKDCYQSTPKIVLDKASEYQYYRTIKRSTSPTQPIQRHCRSLKEHGLTSNSDASCSSVEIVRLNPEQSPRWFLRASHRRKTPCRVNANERL